MTKQNSSKVQSVLVSDLQDLFPIEKMIYEIRGRQVMLDRDLAMLYGVETRRRTKKKRSSRNDIAKMSYFSNFLFKRFVRNIFLVLHF